MKCLAQSYPPNWDIRSDDRFNELPGVIAPMQLLRHFLIERSIPIKVQLLRPSVRQSTRGRVRLQQRPDAVEGRCCWPKSDPISVPRTFTERLRATWIDHHEGRDECGPDDNRRRKASALKTNSSSRLSVHIDRQNVAHRAAARGRNTRPGAEFDDNSGEPWKLERAAEFQIERHRGAHVG